MGPFIGRLSVVAAILAGAATPLTAELNAHFMTAWRPPSGGPEDRLTPAATGHEMESWRQFAKRVENYVVQRRQLEMPLRVVTNPAELVAAEDALANGVRALRSDAKAGDVFGPDAATFQRRIGETLTASGYQAADVLAEIRSEAAGVPPRLTVNDRFDWRFGAFMPPCVLAALPLLPGELQYRFVGRDLVLIDIDAGIIVDVMPHALAVN